MEHTQEAAHIHHAFDAVAAKKEVKKITILLSVLTLIELALGYWMISLEGAGIRLAVKGVICILMLAKAFYIVGYFMHLKHEIRNLIMTIIVPLLLFIWFIGAFLYEGNSYKNLKNTYDRNHKEKSEIKVEPKHHEEQPAKKEGGVE
jgi:cytochrome c oxidase subunit IV